MFEVDAPSGLIVFGDSELVPQSGMDVSLPELQASARNGDLYLIDAEDPVKYRLELFPNEDLPAAIADEYVPHGGTFRLRLPSGCVQIGPIPFSISEQVQVTPGDYLVSTFKHRELDPAVFSDRMRTLVGEADWRFHRRISNFGCVGCLAPLIGGAILLFAQFSREYWWAALIVVAVFGSPMLLSSLLTRLPRFKRIQQTYDSYLRAFPDLVVVLKSSAAAIELSGGWVPGV